MKKTEASKQDNIKDLKGIKKEKDNGTITMDMPEVKDIPGQENVIPPNFREMQDVTISSADEEGEGLLDDLNTDEPVVNDRSSNVSRLEKNLLKKSAGHQPTEETEDFKNMALDSTDDDGELLNEKNIRQDRSGEDLDVPGADLDDDDENIGEEDEENNIYSQRD